MPYMSCPICNRRMSSLFIAAHAEFCKPRSRPRPLISKKSPRPKQSSHSLSTTLRATFSFNSGLNSNAPLEIEFPGFHVFPAVFNDDLHSSLLEKVHTTAPTWEDYRYRKAKNYGPPYDLPKRRFLFGHDAPSAHPLPKYAIDIVIPRLRTLSPFVKEFHPNQLSVNLYTVPGQTHILPHNDCENAHISTAVVGVCLGAACTMTLILPKQHSNTGKTVKHDVQLPKGAVYIMSGDSLRIWQHAIFPGKTKATRTSLTFRDVSPHKDKEIE